MKTKSLPSTDSFCMCMCRLVHSGPDRGSPHSGTELFFATRTGTRLGIEAHLFRTETTKDLSLWTRHIVNGCHSSAEMIREVTTSKCSLTDLSGKINSKTENEMSVNDMSSHELTQTSSGWSEASGTGHCTGFTDVSSDTLRHAAAEANPQRFNRLQG